jgi:DNA-directed RNA polymerase specialized sigma subunit
MNDIGALLRDHKRLIELEASRYAKFVPTYVVLAEAYKLAHKAAEEYDPKLGIKFSTFLHNSLKKLSRISTQYGATVRVPEGLQFKINRLNQVSQGLKDELGREPSTHELSEHSGFSLKETANLLKHRKKDVNINNVGETSVFISSEDDDWIHFVYHDLPERDRVIFEWKTGFGGKPVLSNEEIAKKLHLSPSTVSSRVKMMSDKIAEGLH